MTAAVYFRPLKSQKSSFGNAFSYQLCGSLGSGRFWVLEINRALVEALNNPQHFRTGTCSDEKAATRTIGFDELRMTGVDLENRKLSIRTWHGTRPSSAQDAR